MRKGSKTLKPKNTPNEARTFKVGDVVRIRPWKDMVCEFGLLPWGSVDCPCAFATHMKHLCGRVFKIERIEDNRVFGHGSNWNISTAMIEPFVKRLGQRYEVAVEGLSFRKGVVVTLSKVCGSDASWYVNEAGVEWCLFDIDHPCCEVRYIDKVFEERKEDKDMKKEMKINDLVSGAVVELRNGNKYLALKDASVHGDVKDILLNLGNGGFLILDDYSTDGLDKSQSKFDIMKICQPEYIGNAYWAHVLKRDKNHWTWERAEPKKMTLEQVRDALGYEVEIIENKEEKE